MPLDKITPHVWGFSFGGDEVVLNLAQYVPVQVPRKIFQTTATDDPTFLAKIINIYTSMDQTHRHGRIF